MKLLVWTRGEGLEAEIARVENSFLHHTGECLDMQIDVETVRSWLEEGDTDPEEMAIALEDNVVAGYAWAWKRRENPSISWVMMRINPLIPTSTMLEAAKLLLSWARHSLEAWQEARGATKLRLGLLGGYTMALAQRLVRGLEHYKPSGLLMEARGPVVVEEPPGIVVREAYPWSSDEDLEAIVSIYNDAFSVYEGHHDWDTTRARGYFRRLKARLEPKVLLALVDGVPQGFVDLYIYESICGVRVGYIALLAVARDSQGRGVGSTLLARAVNVLLSEGVESVVLHAIPEVAGLYVRRGFRARRIYVEARVPLSILPTSIYTMQSPSAPG
ncbi:MAG: GNAT family N-acetyltransferase [Desulfurococcales archaeon]|nr:GNAT family N-acetyltransferase [Desulfurococcales archaeon]